MLFRSANAYRQDTLSGSYLNKNRWLDAILKEKIPNEEEYNDIWSSIIANDGSVQHLDILDENQKAVFKTSMEIDQRWVIDLAADRQVYIDQAQSLTYSLDLMLTSSIFMLFISWHGKKV